MKQFNWTGIDEKYKWFAVDQRRGAYVFVNKPSLREDVVWDAEGDIDCVGDYSVEDWKTSLQERPSSFTSRTAETGLRRYEYLRTLNPKQFSDLWQEALTGTTPFDTLIDVAITLKGKTNGIFESSRSLDHTSTLWQRIRMVSHRGRSV